MSVFGTRPEAIKMCPIIKELQKRNIKNVICLTGQHEQMLYQIMNIFNITEDYNLHIMQHNQSLSDVTCKIISNIDVVLKKENPDIVLVHGDTSSSFAAALAAFYHHVPIGHVEAGLRTYNLQSPYPEEFNRHVVDLIADYLFAPTKYAKRQLIAEGKDKKSIFITGNTVIDTMKYTINENYTDSNIQWCGKNKMILLTTHRRENIGQPMEQIFEAVNRIVSENANVRVIYPIHKNPQIREIAYRYFNNKEHIRMLEPLDVFTFHNYINKSYLILTDSGGIQEEASYLGKPVLVLRDTTERPEGVESGVLKVIGTQMKDIFQETQKLLNNKEEYENMSNTICPYGDGRAAEYIVNILIDKFS